MSEAEVVTILRELSRLQTTVEEIVQQNADFRARINDLELSRATEQGAALQRAATIEDKRVVRATDLARHQWVMPAAVASVLLIADALIHHYF